MVAATIAANPRIHGVVADVSQESDVRRLMQVVFERMGGVDFLVNVVGISGPTIPTEEVTTEEWRRTLDVNVTGTFFTVRAAIPYMKGQRFGGIVNFSSASTRVMLPERTPYIVSKCAVEGLTRNLARELGPFNVRANAILPGGINNERLRSVLGRVAERRGERIEEVESGTLKYVSMRSWIEPEEIAHMVQFLCSEQARHITGQLIGVDGNLEWE
jgi:NAD(P)-dependent dehydrogenase (short-subunit alcohol dehydrogenase family)